MVEYLEIYPFKWEYEKILIHISGIVYVDGIELMDDWDEDREIVKELIAILEKFIMHVKKYYRLE